MNYAATYCALVSKRLSNPISKQDCYCETHHIIPKSEGGIDEKDNLVNLTAREHYIAHLLLAKIYNDLKMYSAVAYMKCGFTERQNFKVNSRLYEKMRLHYSKKLSEIGGINKGRPPWNKGKKDCYTKEQLKKLSDSHKGHIPWNKGKHGVQPPPPNKGCPRANEVKARISKTKRMKKLHWYTDGSISIMAKECPNGFKQGRLI